MNQIARAAKIVGSQATLAKMLGVSPGAVSQWISGHRPVPVERCVSIEVATNGIVTRRDLRPDDWHAIWPELVGVGDARAIAVEEAA